MKKIYLLAFGLLIGAGLMAQNVVVYDFEDGNVSGFGNYGGGETVIVEVADNPLVAGLNTSTKVLKFVAPGAWKGANQWKETGVFTAKPLKISLLVYATDIAAGDLAELKIKLDMRNSISGGAITEKYLGDPIAADTWVALEYDLSGGEIWDYKQFAFQNHVAGTYYFDDIAITYEGGEVETGDLLINFEDKTVGDVIPSLSWGGDAVAVVADDPLAAGNNVLEFTPNDYNAAPVLAFTFPEGKTLADYKKFKFKGYFAQGDVGWKHIKVTVTQDEPSGPFDNENSQGTEIGDFNRAEGASTEWETIEIDITNELTLSGTIYVAFGMSTAATGDQGGAGLTTKWYADDIEFLSNPVSIQSVEKTTLNVYSSEGSITIGDASGKQVAVYSLTGAKVFGTSAKSNEVTVNVPTGIYIVVVDGVAKKVAVR